VSNTVKRIIGAILLAIGGGLVIAFVLSEAWFGVIFGAFIGLFGLLALMYPEDAFPQKAKELPQRGMPTADDES